MAVEVGKKDQMSEAGDSMVYKGSETDARPRGLTNRNRQKVFTNQRSPCFWTATAPG